MSMPDYIEQLHKKYSYVLKNIVLNKPFEPIVLRGGKNKPTNTRDLFASIELFQQYEKKEPLHGWQIEWQEWPSKRLGKQLWPALISVDSLDDFLFLVNKKEEVQQFIKTLTILKSWKPALTEWLSDKPELVLLHQPSWPEIMQVTDYLLEHDCSSYYLRNIPVPVHTKFLEKNATILLAILTKLAPDKFDAAKGSLEKVIGVKAKPVLFPLRWLDEQLALQYSDGMDVLAATVENLQIRSWQLNEIWLVENETTLYMLPQRTEALAIWSRGKAIELLAGIPWFNNATIYYWGDMDEDGFSILQQCRKLYPHVKSIFMDADCLQYHFQELDKQPAKYKEPSYNLLTPEEMAALEILFEKNGRIEQEKISHTYVLQKIAGLNHHD